MKKFWLAIAVMCMAVALSAQAEAVIAYDMQSVQTGNQNYGGSVGMDFNVNSPISVTNLGVFDSGGNGISGTLSVTIFNRTGSNPTVTPTLSFTSSSGGTLVGGDRFKALTSPVSLSPGLYSIVAWGYNASEFLGNWAVSHILPWSVENNGGGLISFLGNSRYDSLPGVYPTLTLAGMPTNEWLAGTFQFESSAVPLPSTMLLLGSGLVGLGLLRRKWSLKKISQL